MMWYDGLNGLVNDMFCFQQCMNVPFSPVTRNMYITVSSWDIHFLLTNNKSNSGCGETINILGGLTFVRSHLNGVSLLSGLTWNRVSLLSGITFVRSQMCWDPSKTMGRDLWKNTIYLYLLPFMFHVSRLTFYVLCFTFYRLAFTF